MITRKVEHAIVTNQQSLFLALRSHNGLSIYTIPTIHKLDSQGRADALARISHFIAHSLVKRTRGSHRSANATSVKTSETFCRGLIRVRDQSRQCSIDTKHAH